MADPWCRTHMSSQKKTISSFSSRSNMADENKDIPMDGEIEEQEYDAEKIRMLPGSSDDGTAASFQVLDEDHTLGNALRYMIMKNPEVEFCGYSIPHPSENKLNIRIQTYGNITALEALHQGLDNLSELCTHVEETFTEKVDAGNFATVEP
ncbi:putative DNA-directed RNA polymerases I and III subunit [Clavispora lusitaniae]|nr:DNA-directed RNA polymerases I and III subunit RPAC2 [Clavispora lusitaniae]QFZ29556.1 putative DNA-directed RNA polymerases I and III subunit [Clavispora lusitaniae]QFZ35206.1 putative DNA-directed RNA polymerases I and III subunit [Clavispora lusitaniae]QFZ40900.1 putative DNA-directed RNA polymerases I and III subunit [Clavispora lusitaniae]QFZ46581.1 putative DNA-directed RNA polymerases I and III subunit [Clavispora lusitaniae]